MNVRVHDFAQRGHHVPLVSQQCEFQDRLRSIGQVLPQPVHRFGSDLVSTLFLHAVTVPTRRPIRGLRGLLALYGSRSWVLPLLRCGAATGVALSPVSSGCRVAAAGRCRPICLPQPVQLAPLRLSAVPSPCSERRQRLRHPRPSTASADPGMLAHLLALAIRYVHTSTTTTTTNTPMHSL